MRRTWGRKKEMVQFAGGEWYCPSHGLLLAAKDLVLRCRVKDGADWTAISEIIGEALPDIVAKVGSGREEEMARPSVDFKTNKAGADFRLVLELTQKPAR